MMELTIVMALALIVLGTLQVSALKRIDRLESTHNKILGNRPNRRVTTIMGVSR